jgi:phage terminase large subunit-like protein
MGVDYDSNIYIMDTYHWGRWDSLEIVEKTVELAKKYDARTLATETGPIQGALNPLFDAEMRDQNHYMTIDKTARRGSKIVVAHALRGMMEAGKVYFPETPETSDSLIPNLLSFSDDTDGDDDAVDALSLGALCVERIGKPLPPDVAPVPSWRQEGEIYSEDIWKKADSKKSGIPKLGGQW